MTAIEPSPPLCLKVALPVPVPGAFDYRPPAGSTVSDDWIGCRVRVPFGSRTLVGWVLALGAPETPTAKLKSIIERLDTHCLLGPEMRDTLHWAARYYQAPIGEVYGTAVPGQLREGKAAPDGHVPAWQLSPEGQTRYPTLRTNSAVRALAELLAAGERPEPWLDQHQTGWRTPMRALHKRGWVVRVTLTSTALLPGYAPAAGPSLTDEQAACLDGIGQATGFAVHLIDGVTGSGKTEIYLQAILDCLARGRQALVLVPEIGLTPQTLARFSARLPVPVHVLHSNLSDGERAKSWAAMASGSGRVLLGTRSAVFTPMPEAGLLIIDEEHDASYKQQDGIRYHARDVAIVRAKSLDVPILLGSATPSLESLHNAELGRYRQHRLRKRAGSAQAPKVRIVDVRKLRMQDGLGQAMLDGIGTCLAQGGQALVFKNRRGYAPALLCHDCGFTALCPRCDTTLTLHEGMRSLQCHHCGYRKGKPAACPDCGSLALQAQGVGTERLEEALLRAFPDAVCLRVDSASTRRRDGLDRLLQQLGDAPGILVGTQMLAKGHDLPNLRFVGVVGVDESLFSADFRAHEKLAQLLVQVAGRAGRGQHEGHVLIQTHHPGHPMLSILLDGGYPAYAANALEERRLAGMPPYRFMAVLRCESTHLDGVQQFLQEAGAHLADVRAALSAAVHSTGALPAGMPRRAGMHRWQIILTGDTRQALQQVLGAAMPGLYALRSARKTRWSVDVDPTDFC